MRKPGHSMEPSIEEILASIRSIITDDAVPPSKVPHQPRSIDDTAHSTHNSEGALSGDDREITSQQNMTGSKASGETLQSETSEEVLELTEDFMLMEPQEDVLQQPSLSDTPPQSANETITETSSNVGIPTPLQEENNLNEVFSNLAVEMDRLSGPAPLQDTSPNENIGENEPDTATSDSNSDDAKQASIPELIETKDHSVGQPQISGIAEPQTAAPPPQPSNISAPQTPAPAPKPKQVWSARRLEQAGPPAPTGKSEAQNSQEPGQSEEASHKPQKTTAVSRRDLWAEGVQMPVPDTGPEIPLPMQSDDETAVEPQDAEAETDKNDPGSKRHIVGSFLNRVFGESSPEEAETSAAGQEGLRAQAEKLAQETIANFAEEKLNAPALGNALKSDKEFMDEVASSLESALAETSGDDDEEVASETATTPELPVTEPVEETHAELPSEANLDVALKEALDAEVKPKEDGSALASIPVAEIADDHSETANQEALPEENDGTPDQLSAKVDVSESNAVSVTQKHKAANAEDAPEKENDGGAAPLMSPLKLPANLETGIKEMIKPLIIQWLNENLPRIVEDAVREELIERSATPPDVKTKSRA